MFELTYAQIRDKNFIQAMRKIVDHECKDFKVAYHIGRVGDFVDQHQREADRVFRKLVSGHGDVDPKTQQYTIPEDNREAWDKAFGEFQEHKVKIERKRIRLSDIQGVPLTPSQIVALRPVLDGVDALES